MQPLRVPAWIFALLSLPLFGNTFPEIFNEKTREFETGISKHATESKAQAAAWAALTTAKASLASDSKLDITHVSLKHRLQELFAELHQKENPKPKFTTLKDLMKLFHAQESKGLNTWLTEEELFQIATALRIQIERHLQQGTQKTPFEIVRDLMLRQSLALEKLGVTQIELPENARELLGLPSTTSLAQFRNKLKELSSLDEETTEHIMRNLIKKTIMAAPLESLAESFRLEHQQLFEGLRSRYRLMHPPATYGEALDELRNLRSEIAKHAPIDVGIPPGYRIPVEPDLRGLLNQTRQTPFLLEGSATPASQEELAATGEELKCLKNIRNNGYNVEMSLPGALCGASLVTFRSEVTQCQPGSPVRRFLRTARHCIHRMDLRGTDISINTNPSGPSMAYSRVRIISLANPDGRGGEPISNNNPDSAFLEIELSCETAQKLRPLRIANDADRRKLKGTTAVALGQNRSHNASGAGRNRGVLLANATFDSASSFLHFNSNVTLTSFDTAPTPANRQGGGDADITQPGDSGSFVAACIKKGDAYEPVSIGSVSHVEVRRDSFSGKIGGAASAINDAAFFDALANRGNPILSMSERTIGSRAANH